jgi:hypothetical protein
MKHKRKSLAVLAGICAWFIFGSLVPVAAKEREQPRLQMAATEREGVIQGEWRSFGDIFIKGGDKDQWVQIEIEVIENGAHEKLFLGRIYRDFAPQKTEGDDMSFLLEAAAGDLEFHGNKKKPKAGGRFNFQSNAEYKKGLKELFPENGSNWELFRLALFNVSLDYIKSMHGVEPKFALADIMRLRNFAVSPDYLSDLRKEGGNYTADEVIRLKNFGVPADYPAKFVKAGYEASVEQVTKLKNFGVSPEYAAEWKAAGFDFSPEEIIRLRNFGVPSIYGTELKKAGMSPKAEEIIKLRNFGVTPGYLAELRPDGKYSIDEVVRLRNFGVLPGYIAAWKSAGYQLGVDEMVRLKNAGVSVEYAQASNAEGRKQIPVDLLIQLRNKGVAPEIIRQLRE